MSVSFDSMTLKELTEIEVKVAEAKVKAKANEITAFKQECEILATKRGVDIAEIFGKLGRSKSPVLAKYQDPKSGKTWSGCGHAPRWSHGERSKYAIDGASTQPLKSETAKTLKGPRPAYRDPVSGKTWSGVGRAPFWVVGKDRSKFATG